MKKGRKLSVKKPIFTNNVAGQLSKQQTGPMMLNSQTNEKTKSLIQSANESKINPSQMIYKNPNLTNPLKASAFPQSPDMIGLKQRIIPMD